MNKKLPAVLKPPPDEIDKILRDNMPAIEELIEAIAAGLADCDIKLAELLENQSDQARSVIIDKLREMLKARAEEKEKELDKYLESQRRVEVTRQRNRFMQWLTWIMSEETLRKIRMAFLASPRMEAQVKNIGQDLANFGLQVQLTDKRDLGGMSANVGVSQGVKQDRGKGGGRE
jgi:hypothetical protein